MRKCGKCGELHQRAQSYCAPCHAAYMRENRKPYRHLTDEARKKVIARSYANKYQRCGKLKPQPCEVCGSAAEKHHENYEKPLDVRWMCRKCHLAEHFKEKHEEYA